MLHDRQKMKAIFLEHVFLLQISVIEILRPEQAVVFMV